jgi:DNA processing protein
VTEDAGQASPQEPSSESPDPAHSAARTWRRAAYAISVDLVTRDAVDKLTRAELRDLVSECPPDQQPTRPGFLIRNRIIAALSRGTVVFEAALRSGALNTARHPRAMPAGLAVPGPVTSEQSAGCHELIREYGAMCVTCARDLLEHVEPAAAGPQAGPRRGPAVARDRLEAAPRAVLEQVPARGGRGPATIAVGAGFIRRCDQGWRLMKPD